MHSKVSARSLTMALGGWRTREPAYEALADGIRLLCLDNRLAPRTALPAERELATALQLSRSTVAHAYASLRESGHIESIRGSGSVTLPLAGRQQFRVTAESGAIDLQQASPPAWPGLAGVMADVASDAASLLARSGYDVLGNSALREAIAAGYTRRGLPTDADQVMVTTGAQSAIALLAAVFVARGDRALLETPTYPHAADALRAAGARLVGVPVTTEDGWDLERAEQAFARTLPSVAYLMPRFHNPTGRSMDAEEESVILAAARRAGTIVLIDETTADLVADATAEALSFGADAPGLIRIGSMSKTVWGGLRVGWIRADADTIRRVVAARPARDLGTPEFEQAVALGVFPHMREVIAQRSTLLREGRDTLVDALHARLPGWQVPRVRGGVSLWVGLDAPLSSRVVMAARMRGLYLSAGPRFAIDGGHERHLRIPFTASTGELSRAVDALADAWEHAQRGVPSGMAGALESVV